MTDARKVFTVEVMYRADDTWWVSVNGGEIMLNPDRVNVLRGLLSAVADAIEKIGEPK